MRAASEPDGTTRPLGQFGEHSPHSRDPRHRSPSRSGSGIRLGLSRSMTRKSFMWTPLTTGWCGIRRSNVSFLELPSAGPEQGTQYAAREAVTAPVAGSEVGQNVPASEADRND